MNEILQTLHKVNREQIRSRLQDFKDFYSNPVSWFFDDEHMVLRKVDRNDNERLFEELCFCLLTANTSAESSMKAIDKTRPYLFDSRLDILQLKLKEAGYRYPNKRAEYIFEARENFKQDYEFNIKGVIESYNDIKILRDFLKEYIKGFGYKESSHFLRNIGFPGLAILDKHILRSLVEYEVIKKIPKYLTKKRYFDIENRFMKFCKETGIDMDEMDLLLWSIKNGKVMK